MHHNTARPPQGATDHVLLVHGTWASPSSSSSPLPPVDRETFAARLLHHLDLLAADSGMEPRRFTVEQFQWTGRNSHADRIKAGKSLAERVLTLLECHPEIRVHVVAHSHGGNVLLSAYEAYMAGQYKKGWRTCRSVFAQLIRGGDPATAINNALVDACGQTPEQAFGPSLAAQVREALNQCIEHNAKLVDYIDNDPEAFPPREHDVLDGMSDFTRAQDMSFRPDRRSSHHLRSFYQLWIRAWLRSPKTNRLGALVFLGTPFLIKRWPKKYEGRGRRFPERLKLRGLALIAALPWTIALTLVFAVVVSVVQLSWGPFRFLFLHPAAWTPALVLALLAATLSVSVSAARLTDVNLYFRQFITLLHDHARSADEYLDDRGFGCNRAFVLNSEIADEALLALRSEPILRAMLRPQLRSWIAGVAHVKEEPISWHQRGGRPLWLRGLNITARLRRIGGDVVHRTIGAWLEERGLRFVNKLVLGAGLGLDGAELAGTQIEISHHPKVSYLETVQRDVTDEFRRMAPGTNLPTARAKAPSEPARSDDSRNELLLAAMKEQYGGHSRRWVTARLISDAVGHDEERLRAGIERTEEILGGIPWHHSVYQRNDGLLEEIATFIFGDLGARADLAIEDPYEWPYTVYGDY